MVRVAQRASRALSPGGGLFSDAQGSIYAPGEAVEWAANSPGSRIKIAWSTSRSVNNTVDTHQI